MSIVLYGDSHLLLVLRNGRCVCEVFYRIEYDYIHARKRKLVNAFLGGCFVSVSSQWDTQSHLPSASEPGVAYRPQDEFCSE